jgi:hypothetical protein
MPAQYQYAWCSICGKDAHLQHGVSICFHCAKSTTQILPNAPKNIDAALNVPVHLLPHALWEWKLTPKSVDFLETNEGIVFYHGQGRWLPHLRLGDCAYLIERFRLNIIPLGPKHWWIMATNADVLCAYHFSKVPALVCRWALILTIQKG